MTDGPLIFDRALVRARRRRAALLGPAVFLLDRVADDLAERLGAVLRRFELAADLGTPGDAVRAALARLGSVDSIVVVDAVPEARGPGAGAIPNRVVADEEALPFRDASLDLAVSALALQFVNDLPGALVQIRRALKPDGLFLAALVGGETLTELRQAFAAAESDVEGGASPRVAPFADVRVLGNLLQRAGFALPVADSDRYTLRYASPFALMTELRHMGRPTHSWRAAARHCGARRCCAWPKSIVSDSPTPTAACARRSISSGYQAGRRIRTSSSRSSRARRTRASPRR